MAGEFSKTKFWVLWGKKTSGKKFPSRNELFALTAKQCQDSFSSH